MVSSIGQTISLFFDEMHRVICVAVFGHDIPIILAPVSVNRLMKERSKR
jgi:hypothetical protein